MIIPQKLPLALVVLYTLLASSEQLHSPTGLAASQLATPASAQESRWKELDTQIEELQKQGKTNESVPLAQEAVRIAEATFGPQHANTATALQKLGAAYTALGNYPEGERLLNRALAIREKVFGPEAALPVAESLNSLGEVDYYEGKYTEAELLWKRALAIREKVLGPEHPDVAESLDDLGVLYQNLGRDGEAEPLCKRALAIREKVLGPDHPDVAVSLNNLAVLYNNRGRYGEATLLYKRALTIDEKVQGLEHPDVATALNNLAMSYDDQGRYDEAEPLFKRALAIDEKQLGPDHVLVATVMNDLAKSYNEQGRYDEAEPLLKRSLAIHEKAAGPDHPDVAVDLVNLAVLYRRQNRYGEAEPLLKRALEIYEKVLGPDHPHLATGLANLAILYLQQGRYDEAEPLLKRSLAISEKVLGPDHPRVATTLSYLGSLYYAEGWYSEAEPTFEHCLAILRKQFEYSFTYMSEKDRLQFLDTVRNVFPIYFSFSLSQHDRHPVVAGRMYDLILWQKALVSTSVTALRAQVAASGDPQTIKIFEDLTARKSQSSQLVATRPPGWQDARMRADTEANELEQQLARRVSSLAEQRSLARTTWKDVQKVLKPDDAAVEFIRFPFHDGKKQTDKTYYAALVIRPKNSQPALIQLGEDRGIEGKSFSSYRAEVGIRSLNEGAAGMQTATSPWRSLYDIVWKPLEPALNGAKRIYMSPDGALNEIPLGILQGPNGRRVMERYDARVVLSTRDLLRLSHRPSNNTAILVGNPDFLLSEEEQRTAVNRLRSTKKQEQAILLKSADLSLGPASNKGSRDLTERGACDPLPPAGGVLCPLPGTAAEVQSIGELLRRKKWLVSSYQEEQALEEVVKSAERPRVLHLATHGFFLSDQQLKLGESLNMTPSGLEDPMLRSGLFFAGADRVLKDEPPIEGVENGELTAYEATALNLQGTELVVLSACETGRGQVQNGEGVFGLRRALQEAGTESVLMTLWSVPDRETQELMTLFYRNWLDGMEKPVALQRAQMEIRERVKQRYGHDLPFYWGGFVLIGR
jgi:CHAT domain-containing protein/Tfp pilus assembly protein PilF